MTKSISERLREELQKSGWTPSTIGRAAGVSPGIIHRFLSGERGLALDTIDRICDVLALELTPSTTRKPQPLVNYPPGRRKRNWEQMERDRAVMPLDEIEAREAARLEANKTLKGDERTVSDGKPVIRKQAKGRVEQPEEQTEIEVDG